MQSKKITLEKCQFIHVLKALKQGLKVQEKVIFVVIFSKYKSQNAYFFAADRSKAVGTKQEILSDSKILIYFCKKHEFLANVCQLVKKCSLL